MSKVPARSLNPRGRRTRQDFKIGTAPRAQIARMIRGRPDVATMVRQFMQQMLARATVARERPR